MPLKMMPPPTRRASSRPPPSLSEADPIEIFELLENSHDEEASPYRQLYATTLAAGLERSSADVFAFAQLLNAVDVSSGVEYAMRQAGFVLGFEYCRQLFLGELDLAALKRDGGIE